MERSLQSESISHPWQFALPQKTVGTTPESGSKAGQDCKIAAYKGVKSTVVGWKIQDLKGQA